MEKKELFRIIQTILGNPPKTESPKQPIYTRILIALSKLPVFNQIMQLGYTQGYRDQLTDLRKRSAVKLDKLGS